MVTRSGERRRDCVVIGASLRAARWKPGQELQWQDTTILFEGQQGQF